MPSGRYPPERRPLTPREELVLRRRALGRTNLEVAEDLGITEQTAKNHAVSAYRKLGALCLVDALRELGWLVVPAPGDLRGRVAGAYCPR